MKTLYVGGGHFLNRFNSLEAAVERAQNDDTIEICKDLKDVHVYIAKNIIIHGNGHTITPADGKAAMECALYVTIENLCFECQPRTNAILIRNGGVLKNISTKIIGPARALYPTLVQRGGTLTIEDSHIMQMETYQSHGSTNTVTFFKKSVLADYYGGFACLEDDDYSMSKFRGMTSISESVIERALLDGVCTLSDTVLKNFNKAAGKVTLTSCTLGARKGELVHRLDEPADGPLKNLKPDAVPYALHIKGGRVMAENHSSDSDRDSIGFYMTSGSLDIRHTNTSNDRARHLIKGGSVVFNSVTDDGFYEIRQAKCGIIRSNVNTSMEGRTAMEELNSMVGLLSVKMQIRSIMNTISMNMKHPEKDFGFSHHMIFAGDPGTGKTTVARLVAQALFEIGAIPENKCMEVPASQMIKGFVGQTGEHVESILQKALGGVLFIDEAYELTVKDGQNTFNNDALAVLLRYMEDHRRELVVIAAGYEKEMKDFLASNVGLSRRFQWVEFEDYTPEEMADIFLSMAERYDESFDMDDPSGPVTDCFKSLTAFYMVRPDSKGRITNGGNGGLVRNLFQQVVFARNNRVAETPETDTMITQADLENGMREEMKKAMNIVYGKKRMNIFK